MVLAARSKLTVPALFAAALDKNITELYLAGGLVSFRSIVDTENYDHSFANFVPGLLRHTDLPDVAAALAPRPVTLAGTMDAAAARAWRAPPCTALYSGGHVKMRDKADWDIDASFRLERVKACLLRAPAPVKTNPLELAEVAMPTARGRRGAGAGDGLRRVPDRSARSRGRAQAAQIAGDSGPSGGGRGSRRWERERAGFIRGDRVGIAWLHKTDGLCEYCRAGKENLCDSATFTGWMVDGGYAEYAVAPEAFVYAIPESFQRSGCRAAALRGDHRLPRAAAFGNRARRAAGLLRIWRGGTCWRSR